MKLNKIILFIMNIGIFASVEYEKPDSLGI